MSTEEIADFIQELYGELHQAGKRIDEQDARIAALFAMMRQACDAAGITTRALTLVSAEMRVS